VTITATAPDLGTAPGRETRYGPLLVIFAHPDDEAFGIAGTIAAATARGVRVVEISATRGEGGKTGDPRLDTPEILGAVREQELRAAMALVGVHDVRFLDYRDSGMVGTPDNDDPRAFMRAPEADVVAKLVPHIRAVQPHTIVTFGPDGIYGHPDHLAIHRAATAAVHAAADPAYAPPVFAPWQTPAFYYHTAPREQLQAMADLPDGPFRDLPAEQRARLGTPAAEIDTVVDVAAHRDLKQRAIAAHRTQTGEGGPLSTMPTERRAAMLAHEHFVRVHLPWDPAEGPPADFIADLAAATPTTAA